jgi:hypothetical protein
MTNRQKKCADCTVRTDVDVMTDTWQTVRHVVGVVGSHVDESAYDTWLVCGEWDGDTWPNQWPPRVT